MLFKSLLATCCVALLSALIEAGPIGMDAPPPTTTTTSDMSSSTPVDTSIHVHSTTHANPLQYSVGYVGYWSNNYNSMNVAPEDVPKSYLNLDVPPEVIDASGYTHIIVAYAPLNVNRELVFDEEEDEQEVEQSFELVLETLFPKIEGDYYLKKLVNNVKRNYPGVKVIISIGNLNFAHDIANEERRLMFIKSAKDFMTICHVDGIDFAWRYPSNDDRLSNQGDKDNFVQFVKEMREGFQEQYTISIALPLADSYIAQALNIELMAPYLDFITIMAHDINGPEDYEKGIGMRPHAAMKDVKDSLNLPISLKNVPKEKIFLGPTFWCLAYKETDPVSSVSNL